MKSNGSQIEQTIVAKALEQGASLAGIARVDDLKKSRSFEIYDKKPYYDDYKGVEWNPEHKAVLVWALVSVGTPASANAARITNCSSSSSTRYPR